MISFEFIRSINFGQYLPIQSVLHSLDPRIKILGSLALICGLTFSPNLYGLFFGMIIIFVLFLIGKVSLGFGLNGLKAPMPFLILLGLIRLMFPTTGSTSTHLLEIGFIIITLESMQAAIILIVRFVDLILFLSLASFCISTSQMISGVRALLHPFRTPSGFTDDLAMTLQVALRFLPLLAQSAERIAKAQYSRGAQWGAGKGNLIKRVQQVFPLIIPLFLSSLSRAERMALAMDARAYGSQSERTSLVQLEFRTGDFLAIPLFLLIEGIILTL